MIPQTPAVDVWQYREDLARLARYLCRHPEDAEDVTHTALVKAAEKLDGFRAESSVRTWLHTITTNECRMLRRRKQPSPLDAMFDSDSESWRIAADADPEELAVELETRRELLDALTRISGRHRCALMLKDGAGLSLEETARLMETTVPGVKSLLHCARAALREQLVGTET